MNANDVVLGRFASVIRKYGIKGKSFDLYDQKN